LPEADLLARGLTIGGNEDVGVAARLMYRKRMRCPRAVSLDGHLIGIISAPTSSARTAGSIIPLCR